MKRTVHIGRASKLGTTDPPQTIIRIEMIPRFNERLEGWAVRADIYYSLQAKTLADALTDSLPQATLHRLTAELMRRAARGNFYRGATR